MTPNSPFTDLILNKDIYILLHLTKYMSPSDLRSLRGVNKHIETILRQETKFIQNAMMEAIVDQTLETPEILLRAKWRPRREIANYMIHNIGGTLIQHITSHIKDNGSKRVVLSHKKNVIQYFFPVF